MVNMRANYCYWWCQYTWKWVYPANISGCGVCRQGRFYNSHIIEAHWAVRVAKFRLTTNSLARSLFLRVQFQSEQSFYTKVNVCSHVENKTDFVMSPRNWKINHTDLSCWLHHNRDLLSKTFKTNINVMYGPDCILIKKSFCTTAFYFKCFRVYQAVLSAKCYLKIKKSIKGILTGK